MLKMKFYIVNTGTKFIMYVEILSTVNVFSNSSETLNAINKRGWLTVLDKWLNAKFTMRELYTLSVDSNWPFIAVNQDTEQIGIIGTEHSSPEQTKSHVVVRCKAPRVLYWLVFIQNNSHAGQNIMCVVIQNNIWISYNMQLSYIKFLLNHVYALILNWLERILLISGVLE